MQVRQWLIVVWGFILCATLCACSVLIDAQEPVATWEPLPTRTPADMRPPSATPASTSTSVPPTATSTATRKPPTATVDVTQTAHVEDALARTEQIRDQAWTHVTETNPDVPFPQTPSWRRTMADTTQGFDVHYTSDEWRMMISAPTSVSPQDLYAVEIAGPNDFFWQAEIDGEGRILSETPQATATPTSTPERVEAWRGRLRSLPADSTFDDYFRRLGGEGGQYGIEAVDTQTEQDLTKWRDTGRIVSIWGVLQKDVEDYGDVRIRVERLAAEPAPVSHSELVEGWIGTVHALPSQSLYDDYFRGQSPSGQYGIASHVHNLAQALIGYRDTGTVIRIWGVLDYGVSDYGEKRITVTRIQVLER